VDGSLHHCLSSLFPTLVLISSQLDEVPKVASLELLDLNSGDCNEDGCHDLRAVSIDEKLLLDLLFIDNISQILLQERWTILLDQCIQLVLYYVLLVQVLLESVVCTLLDG